MTSSVGHALNSVVGRIDNPLSDVTGSNVFHKSWRLAPGIRAKTSAGPVRSNCVSPGKRTSPILMVEALNVTPNVLTMVIS